MQPISLAILITALPGVVSLELNTNEYKPLKVTFDKGLAKAEVKSLQTSFDHGLKKSSFENKVLNGAPKLQLKQRSEPTTAPAAAEPTQLASSADVPVSVPVPVPVENKTSVTEVYQGLKPVAWIHMPKCGSSFVNTLLHHDGICPNFPKDQYYEGIVVNDENKRSGKTMEHFFSQQSTNPTKICPEGFSTTYTPLGGHQGMGDDLWEQNKGHVVTFFRKPEERIISGWNWKMHGWDMKKYMPPKNFLQYAGILAGCQVRMLTMEHKGSGPEAICGNKHRPTKDEQNLAISRMQEMPFIGITEEWDFSVCLFHKMFGGPCMDYEFLNARKNNATDKFDENFQKIFRTQYRDQYDRPLYDAAKERFASLKAQHGINREQCEKVCSAATSGPFSVKDEQGRKVEVDPKKIAKFSQDWPGRTQFSDEALAAAEEGLANSHTEVSFARLPKDPRIEMEDLSDSLEYLGTPEQKIKDLALVKVLSK